MGKLLSVPHDERPTSWVMPYRVEVFALDEGPAEPLIFLCSRCAQATPQAAPTVLVDGRRYKCAVCGKTLVNEAP